MDANSISIATKVAPPVAGAAVGILMQDYNGHPAWMMFLGLTVSLAFGIASSVGRAKDKKEAISAFKYNAGTLWLIACVTAWRAHLDIPTAMIAALGTGLVGSPLIDWAVKVHETLKKP